VEKNISELKLKIDTMRKTLVNKNLLKMYDLARQGVRMPVVAIVDGGRCKGCNIRISNDTLAALSHAETFGQCEACGRLLYAEEQEEFFDDEND
jgi:predicted  nucleic acid-binding Zn-ribbon protein